MTQSRLDSLLEKAKNNEITISEVAEIMGSSLQSNSKHSKDIKELLTRVMSKLESIEQKVNYLYENNSPVFAAVLEDEKEDWIVLLFYCAVSAKLNFTLNGWSVS